MSVLFQIHRPTFNEQCQSELTDRKANVLFGLREIIETSTLIRRLATASAYSLTKCIAELCIKSNQSESKNLDDASASFYARFYSFFFVLCSLSDFSFLSYRRLYSKALTRNEKPFHVYSSGWIRRFTWYLFFCLELNLIWEDAYLFIISDIIDNSWFGQCRWTQS